MEFSSLIPSLLIITAVICLHLQAPITELRGLTLQEGVIDMNLFSLFIRKDNLVLSIFAFELF